MFAKAILLVLVFLQYSVIRALSTSNEVWRSTRMVKSACEQEEKYQETGQFPEPIKDQQTKDYCGWFSKGKPRGDACADIRVHFSSCENKTIARHVSTRVINGTNARRAFPSIAYFQTCSGSIINNRWLLTAGHCFAPPRRTNRFVGWYDLDNIKNDPYRVVVKSERDISHENYTRDNPDSQYDIGLSRVTEFNYSDGVQPIVMPPSNDFRYMGPAYFVGYGWNSTETRSLFVQEFTLPVISPEICNNLWPDQNVTDEAHICAGYFGSGKRTCSGDSGGPLFICQNYKIVQYGLLRGGTENCGDTPSLFMRLSNFANWISKTIASN